MEKILIELNGCDGTTEIEMEVSSEQFDFLKTVAAKSEANSHYGCEPIISIKSLAPPKTN